MLIGFILAATMISSIPIYTDGVMQRVLTKDLENYFVTHNTYPGSFDLSVPMLNHEKEGFKVFFDATEKAIKTQYINQIKLPTLLNFNRLSMEFMYFNSTADEINYQYNKVNIRGANNTASHIKITFGKMFSTKVEGDIIEAVVTEEAMEALKLNLNKVYQIKNSLDEKSEPINIKFVGIFENKNSKDIFWNKGLSDYSSTFLVDYSTLKKYLTTDKGQLITSEWFSAFDYSKINTTNINNILVSMKNVEAEINGGLNADFEVPAIQIMDSYNTRVKLLKTTLLVLQLPLIIMLLFYLFMVSQLIINQDKNEIAVLKSRGAGRNFILLSYLVQGLIMSGIAMAIGPILSLLICTLIGSSSGFLEMVQRTGLDLKLNLSSYLYALGACSIFIITMLIPAFIASNTSIVLSKQVSARKNKPPFWKKFFIDIIFLGISIYGIYLYKSQQKILNITGAQGIDIPIDPILFIMTTLFILGIGMLFLRLFPYVVSFIYRLGRSRWNPAMYSSLLEVSRSGSKDHFIILFLVITIATGIFSANAARTINTNIAEKQKYDVGADIILAPKWDNNLPPPVVYGPPPPKNLQPEIIFKEPNFTNFSNLSGVQMATKVLRIPSVSVGILGKARNAKRQNAYFMGIIPNEFGQIAWFRSDLLKYHWYNYLNFLTKYPSGILISSSIAKNNNVKVGDELPITVGGYNIDTSFNATVLGIVDYWPTFNPFSSVDTGNATNLIVANLNYIQQILSLTPYEVWIKKAPGATSAQIYNDLNKKELGISSFHDTSQRIIVKMNDPIIQGTNGSLTLGFIVNLAVTMIGFLIFWIISIKGRTLQFGVLRAMGLSLKEVIKMIISEVLLVSSSGILVGIITGEITSNLFVPMLQITGSAADAVPSFRITSYFGDYIKIYIVLGIMLFISFVVLASLISKIDMNQALKLGED
ncbi:MAG TPA: FtsX-like permease family protein [Clostridiaceae bacterium]